MSKRGRPQKKTIQEPPSAIIARDIPPEELETTIADVSDRMMHYAERPKGGKCCPECSAFPVVTVQKRGAYASYRCRECGFRWEVVE